VRTPPRAQRGEQLAARLKGCLRRSIRPPPPWQRAVTARTWARSAASFMAAESSARAWPWTSSAAP